MLHLNLLLWSSRSDPNSSKRRLTEVSIVAVHGLGGDWEQTWTEENGQIWLRDFLPSHLPHRARVFSYGYDSSTAFSKSVADIDVQAAILLDRLEGKRSALAEQSRPVVFIAHSLGGILVKKVSVTAEMPTGSTFLSSLVIC